MTDDFGLAPGSQQNPENDEFFSDFIQETEEHLESIEKTVIDLETDRRNIELINGLFRSFHTVKGLAGFVEQEMIRAIAHKTETLLEGCRKGRLEVHKSTVDLILRSTDFIRNICANPSLVREESFASAVERHLGSIMLFSSEERPMGTVTSLLDEAEGLAPENPRDPLEDSGLSRSETGFEEPDTAGVKIESNEPPSFAEEDVPTSSERVFTERADSPSDTGEIDGIVAHASADNGVPTGLECVSTEQVESPFEPEKTEFCDAALTEPDLPSEAPVSESSKIDVAKISGSEPAFSSIQISSFHKDSIERMLHLLGEASLLFSQLEQDCQRSSDGQGTKGAVIPRIARALQNIQNIAISLSLVPFSYCCEKIKNACGFFEMSQRLSVTFGETSLRSDLSVSDILADRMIFWFQSIVKEPLRKLSPVPGYPILSIDISAIEAEGQSYFRIACANRGVLEDKEFQPLIRIDLLNGQYRSCGYSSHIDKVDGGTVACTVKIPTQSSLINGLIVEIAGYSLVIPTRNVRSILKPKRDQWVIVKEKRRMVKVRERLIPIIPIETVFSIKPEESDREDILILVLESEKREKALPVDKVLGRRDLISKSLGAEFDHLAFVKAGAILENGKISLIANIEELFKYGE